MNKFHAASAEDTAKHWKTDLKTGLSRKEAKKRLAADGPNVLEEKKRPNLFTRFISQFNDFMIIILLAAAVISFITGAMDGDGDLIEPVIILVIVILNALMGIIQENKAAKSLEELKKMSAPHAVVLRDGREEEIPASEVVTGDILVLSAGDIAPADCRLIQSINLQTDESSLTGESVPVAKDANAILPELTPIADCANMVYSSAWITEGRGRGIVTAVGMNTEVGKIAGLILSEAAPQTPLQKRLAQAGKYLGTAALAICAVIFGLGLMRHIPPLDMFVTSVSLAVAAIPEGLPAIVTIMLAIGVQKMAKHHAVIRHLPSVETLGSAQIICSDKTGTLTQNKMTVQETYAEDEAALYKNAMLCCGAASRNPTDLAILEGGAKRGLDKGDLDKRFRTLEEIPFNSTRKRMSVLCSNMNGYRVIVKGAVDYILPLCTQYKSGDGAHPLSAKKRKEILGKNQELADRALRVIAVAYADTQEKKLSETSLIFVGMLAMADPPRPEAARAVEVCREAGIRPIMITGDHPATAQAVAAELGICKKEDQVMTGAQLDHISEEELDSRLESCSVYARVTPEHKVRIVKAWQKKNKIVAMTGDGVNDAPALKAADIGCSLGMAGTEVAKSSSDMILSDDNFATIVAAVRHGREIYENIKKAVKFLLSSNTGEILTIFTALLIGWPAPLAAIQLLWVNLVTDSLPAVALGVDPSSEDLMRRPPDRRGLFTKRMVGEILLEGGMIGALALLAFTVGRTVFGSLLVGQTMAFATLSISQLVHSFNMRSEGSVLKAGILKNHALVGSFLAGTLLQTAVISIPFLASLFKVCPLNGMQWLITAILSLMPLIIIEGAKWIAK